MKRRITKRELEITDESKIIEILDKCKVLHLAMVDGDEPYVIAMNYGYTMEDGKLTLYMHGATRGRKLDVLRANPKVCFEMDCDLDPFEGDLPCQYGISYSSVIGTGKAEIVENPQDKMQALTFLMKTQTGKDFEFNERLVSAVSVIKVEVAEYTAKHRPVPPMRAKEK